MKNLGLHSLLWRTMINLPILTTLLIHLYLKGWENVLLELGSERVNTANKEAFVLCCGAAKWLFTTGVLQPSIQNLRTIKHVFSRQSGPAFFSAILGGDTFWQWTLVGTGVDAFSVHMWVILSGGTDAETTVHVIDVKVMIASPI